MRPPALDVSSFTALPEGLDGGKSGLGFYCLPGVIGFLRWCLNPPNDGARMSKRIRIGSDCL